MPALGRKFALRKYQKLCFATANYSNTERDADKKEEKGMPHLTLQPGAELRLKKRRYRRETTAPGWCEAIHVKSGTRGIVQYKHISIRDAPVEEQPYFMSCQDRAVIDHTLRTSGRSPGKFLVRNCMSDVGCYVLCVLASDQTVKHYKIKGRHDTGATRYYISAAYQFASVPELIRHYQHNQCGLATMLTAPVTFTQY
eukprot:m.135769 g.135769  ORF g.135769 m.135769 type:complete len:198 (-) comp13983_c0_seq1:339-932(-)